jgi:hypothetical protein
MLESINKVFINAWNDNGNGTRLIGNILELFRQINEMIKNAADAYRRAFDDSGAGAIALGNLIKLAGDIIGFLGDIARSFSHAFESPSGEAMFEAIIGLAGTVLGILGDITTAVRNAWNDEGAGDRYIQSIFDALTAIFQLLGSLGEAFRNVWNNGTGETICKNILDILTGVNDTVGILADKFREAWEEGGNGEEIIQAVLNIANDVLEAVKQGVEATKDWASDLTFEPLLEAWGTLLEAIEPVVDIITDGLAWAYENVLLPFGKWTIEEALPGVIEALGAAFDVLHAALEAISPGLEKMWNNVIKPLADSVGAIIIEILKGITEKLEAFAGWINNNQEQFSDIVDTCMIFVAVWLGAKGIAGIISGITGAASALQGGLALLASAGFNPVIIAIGAVIAGCVLLVRHWDDVKGILLDPVPMDTFEEITITMSGLESVLFELSQSSELSSDQIDTLRSTLSNAKLEGMDAKDALAAFKDACEKAGVGTEPLNEALENAGICAENLKDSIEGVGDTTKETADVVEQATSETKSAVESNFGKVTDAAKDAGIALDDLGTEGDELESVMSSAMKEIYGAADEYIVGVQTTVKDTKETFKDLSAGSEDMSKDVSSDFSSLRTNVTNEMKTASEEATSKAATMEKDVNSHSKEIDTKTAEYFAAVKETVRTCMNNIADVAEMKAKTVKREALSAFRGLSEEARPLFEKVQSDVDEVLGSAAKDAKK